MLSKRYESDLGEQFVVRDRDISTQKHLFKYLGPTMYFKEFMMNNGMSNVKLFINKIQYGKIYL